MEAIQKQDRKPLFLNKPTEEMVKSLYQEEFKTKNTLQIKHYSSTQDSEVFSVNNQHILKIPQTVKGIQEIKSEQKFTDYLRDKIQLQLPKISYKTHPLAYASYQKLNGQTFKKEQYQYLTEVEKNNLAQQIVKVMIAHHQIKIEAIKAENFIFSPSWTISLELIQDQLGSTKEQALKSLVNEVISNHRLLKVPKENNVFGHFDLHGSNILFDENHKNISAVIDFGNCKIGDIHQDLSCMNLSSIDLSERIINQYEKKTQKKLNRRLIQHYTTLFYLNLLSVLKKRKLKDTFSEDLHYWQLKFEDWYHHLLKERAQKKLNSIKPQTPISNQWQQWIASNIMQGSSEKIIHKKLLKKGYSPIDITTEILKAKAHPYCQAGKDMAFTLKKRHWLIDTVNALNSMDQRYAQKIEKIKTPEYDVFIQQYYSKNLPVVLTEGIDHWEALKNWTPDYIEKLIGDKEVEIQSDREKDPLYERNSVQHKKKILMKYYVKLIKNGGTNNYYMTANNTENSSKSLEQLFEQVGDFGKGYRQKENIKSANYFWFGPKGSYTPLHHDLTNNMLVQIYGRKKVTLIPALQVDKLYNDLGVFSAAAYPNVDFKKHPLMQETTPISIVLKPGEALFIPIGWWHTVEALDISINISFTNFNASNDFSKTFPKNKIV